MTTKTLLAVLGPAIVATLIVELFNLTAILSPAPLSFSLALLASIATLFVYNAHGKAAPRRKTAASVSPTGGNGGKELGNVKWFNSNKGFGFITRDNGEEIFVHFRSIVNGKTLRDGQRVEFAVTNGTKGLQADQVVALK